MDPFKYLNSLSLFGSGKGYNPGLERVEYLLEYLGNPHKSLNVVHIAGTNGKGSTAAIIERIYREAGYRTALYTSPHFFHFNERIKINGRSCSTVEIADILAEIKRAADLMKKKKNMEASYFEVITALAFKYFKREEAELVILETGLGGRLDATNTVKSPLISLITSISLEHSSILGDNIEKIAAEKAGIIKNNSKLITAVQDKNALEVLRKKAAARNSKFIDLDEEYEVIKAEGNLRENHIRLKRTKKRSKSYSLALKGRHQARNFALALRTVSELNNNFPVSEAEIRRAAKDIYWPGRMQQIADKPLFLLDAAHNPAAFEEILRVIADSISEFKNFRVVFSVLEDKDLSSILDKFSLYSLKPKFYLAENSSFRTIKLRKLKEQVEKNNFEFKSFSNLTAASRSAYNNAEKEDLILAAGSFNTVFEAGVEFFSKNI